MGIFAISGFGFRVSGFGFRVSGFGFRVSDSQKRNLGLSGLGSGLWVKGPGEHYWLYGLTFEVDIIT